MVENNKSTEELENKEDNNQDFSVGNIFEDFENDSDLENDINKKEAEIKKDIYYYLKQVSGFIKYINIFLIIAVILAYFYVDIQKSEKSSEIFTPVCGLLLGDEVDYTELSNIGTGAIEGCSSVTLFHKTYKNAIDIESKNIFEKLLGIATDYYTMKDFINSKEVVFLLDSTENKKNPLDMLIRFDKAKNDFLVKDKLRIQCNDITVSDTVFSAKCYAYSSAWDKKKIPGFDGGKSENDLRGGTSISLASSFLNFLERQDDLILLDKQKVFKIEDVVGEASYVYRTPFSVKIAKRKLNLK